MAAIVEQPRQLRRGTLPSTAHRQRRRAVASPIERRWDKAQLRPVDRMPNRERRSNRSAISHGGHPTEQLEDGDGGDLRTVEMRQCEPHRCTHGEEHARS